MIKRTYPLDERITLKYGAGGRAMRALIEQVFLAGQNGVVDGIGLDAMDDGAAIRIGDRWLVITTDSHVIHPIFFPGGDIGSLAVAGTVNDLAMMGATESPTLTFSVILEEGFALEALERIQSSVRATCRAAGATIVTGDTKVMGAGDLDGIVINTTGVALTSRLVPDSGLRPGDRIIVTGSIADHGFAVLAGRHDLVFETPLLSDVAPINRLVRAALDAGGESVVALKDPTRGGLASALREMAAKSGVGIVLEEACIPMSDQVRSAAELLGIDPLHVANEGKALLGVHPDAVETVLAALRSQPLGKDAAVVGTCTAERAGDVILDTGIGRRLVAEIEGNPLPRIC